MREPFASTSQNNFQQTKLKFYAEKNYVSKYKKMQIKKVEERQGYFKKK